MKYNSGNDFNHIKNSKHVDICISIEQTAKIILKKCYTAESLKSKLKKEKFSFLINACV